MDDFRKEQLEKFISYFQSLIDASVDPYRHEIQGYYFDQRLRDKAEECFNRAIQAGKTPNFIADTERIALSLLMEANRCIFRMMYGYKIEYVYFPDMRVHKLEVCDTLLELVADIHDGY